jgi:hypothetical protein
MTDSGCLNLSLAHPEAAFLYNGTKPRVRLDGAELPVAGWGRHQLPVPAGPHRLQIWVRYALPRKAGRAALGIVVPAGGTLDLEYMAPMFTMARGSLGTRLDERMLRHQFAVHGRSGRPAGLAARHIADLRYPAAATRSQPQADRPSTPANASTRRFHQLRSGVCRPRSVGLDRRSLMRWSRTIGRRGVLCRTTPVVWSVSISAT